MKKDFSVISLYAYAPMKKCLAVTGTMFIAEVLLYFLVYAKRLSINAHTGFIAELISENLDGVIFWISLLFLFFALAGTPLAKGKGAYTLERLSVTKRKQYWLYVLVCLMYILLFYAARAVSVILQLNIVEKYSGIAFGPQGAYLAIISNRAMLAGLPMNNVTVLWISAFAIVCISMMAAHFAFNRIDMQISEF